MMNVFVRSGVVMSILLPLLASGCTAEENSVEYSSGQISRSDKSVMIPKQLVGNIERLYLETARDEDREELFSDAEVVAKIPRRYLNLQVKLRQRASGTLTANTVFHPPRGGGVIDLKNFVVGKRGSFYVEMSVINGSDGQKLPLDAIKVYFVSRSKKRLIDGREFGDGCNSYSDITKFYRSTIAENGLRINATDARYLSVIGGTFYFVAPKAEALYLGSITFEDTRYSDLTCS